MIFLLLQLIYLILEYQNSKLKKINYYINDILSSLGKFYSPLVYEIVIYAMDVNVLHITNGNAGFRYS